MRPDPAHSNAPSRDSVSQHQINTLLSLVATLEPFVNPAPRDPDATFPPQLDGGAACAAVATFTKACDRLDKILDDESRWTLTQSDALLKAIQTVAEKQAVFLDQQAESAKNIRRPSFQLRPTLILVDGQYVAYYGNPLLEGNVIVGQGDTPGSALRDFDAAFERVPKDQLKLILEGEENQPVIPEKKPRRKKSK